MEKRICSKCKEEKDLSEYYFRKKDNRYMTVCKTCMKLKSKKYRESHKDYYKKYMHIYSNTHKEYYKNYMMNNSHKYKTLSEKWYTEHKKERQEYQRNYYNDHKDTVRTYNRSYRDKLKKIDSVYKEKIKISQKIRKVFKTRGKVGNDWLERITNKENYDLYKYLLHTFKENYGFEYDGRDVHIDHIIPLSRAKTIDDVHKLNNYKNLQLLTPEDNMLKWKY